jgi:hypothetical protein
MDLVKFNALPGTYQEKIDAVQEYGLKQPQVDCPVIHRFAPGLYIREVSIPAGTMAVGHFQKKEHLNIMLKGKVDIINDNGEVETLTAPLSFVGQPGRKIGHIREDMVWQNIYATEETDVEKLEDTYLDKTEGWLNHLESEKIKLLENKQGSVEYERLLDELGVTEAQVREETEREDNIVRLPYGDYKFKIGDSLIQGKGIHATFDIEPGEIIGPARIDDFRTILGRYTNHSDNPNTEPIKQGNKVIFKALSDIKGCKGGHDGEEITIDYRKAFEIAQEFNQEVLCLH